eukprot:6127120-Pleurochrysis_carterae.AAC.1
MLYNAQASPASASSTIFGSRLPASHQVLLSKEGLHDLDHDYTHDLTSEGLYDLDHDYTHDLTSEGLHDLDHDYTHAPD